MGSKKLYQDFYALLEAPEDDNPAGRDTEALPREQEVLQEDAKEHATINQQRQSESASYKVLGELFAEISIDITRLSIPPNVKAASGLSRRVATLLVRSELEEIIRSDKISTRTKSELENELAEYMNCLVMTDTRVRRSSRSEAIATQKTLLLKGSVTFADLPKIFLPGDIAYTAEPTSIKDTFYEQCWMIAKCEPAAEGRRSAILISGKKWCFDATSDNSWYLAAAEVLIYAYDSERRIKLDDIGVVPLKGFSAEEQRTISDRMIARGRLYLEMSQVKVECWEDSGPSCFPPNYSERRLRKPRESSFKKLSPWMWWDSVTRERVALNNLSSNLPISTSSSIPHPIGPKNSMGKDCDQMLLICSGAMFVRTLPDFAWLSIFIDRLTPVQWKEFELNQDASSITAGISLPQPSRTEMELSQCDYQPNGKIIVVRTSMPFMPPTIAAVAENARRPLVRLDLLAIIHPDNDFIVHLQQTFQDAQQIGAYLYLHNFASLVAKRSCKDRKGCVEIRRFLDLMKLFDGVVLVCLSKEDETDHIFDMMAPTELDLQDSPVTNSEVWRHLLHFDSTRPKWDAYRFDGSTSPGPVRYPKTPNYFGTYEPPRRY